MGEEELLGVKMRVRGIIVIVIVMVIMLIMKKGKNRKRNEMNVLLIGEK